MVHFKLGINKSISENKWYFYLFLLVNFLISSYFYGTSLDLFNSGYFIHFDVFFDMDPNFFLLRFLEGEVFSKIIHPMLLILIFPFRFGSFLLDTSIENSILVFHFVFIFMKNIFFYLILKNLKFRNIEALILTTAFIFSGSNMIFGIIPDHFNISNLLILLLIYVLTLKRVNFLTSSVFLVFLGVFISGITVSNLITYFICLWVWYFFKRNMTVGDSFKSSVKLSSISFFITFLSYFLLDFVLKRIGWMRVLTESPGKFKALGFNFSKIFWDHWLIYKNFFNLDSLWNPFYNNLKALWNSFFLFGVNSDIQQWCFGPNSPGTRFNLPCLSLNVKTNGVVDEYLFVLFSLVLIMMSIYFLHKKNKYLSFLCFVPISFNFLFHTFWGNEPFLYTQHYLAFLFLPVCYFVKNRIFIQVGILALLVITNISFIQLDILN